MPNNSGYWHNRVNLANTMIAQGFILAPYYCHKAVANTIHEPPIMTECLATLRQSAEQVVLHPTTTSSVTCPGRAQLSLPTMRHLVPQAIRASPGDTGCPPLEYVDVFMDDFILLTQGPVE
jgi:hypothetical protein